MSDMLKEAIVDAKALRESALKNAETIVIDKYSAEVRKTLEHILEQDEMDLDMGGEMAPEEMGAPPEDPAMDPMAAEADMGEPMAEEAEGEAEEIVENEDDLPFGATDGLANAEGKNLDSFLAPGEDIEVSINLGALQEALQTLQDNEEVEINLSETTSDDPAAAVSDVNPSAGYEAEEEEEGEEESGPKVAAAAEQDKLSGYGGTNENLDSIVDALAEKLTVDLGAELSGWAGRPTSQLKHEQERELAGMQSDDVKEDLEDLNKAQEKLVAENKQLKEQNDQYKQAVEELREGLQDVNLSNARLLYTNRVLRNTSLNERQKT